MSKKQGIKQLNSQKGMTAGEVIIALLIILTTLGVVGMLYTNLVINSRGIDRKTGATRITTNILENVSMTYYDDIESVLNTNGLASVVGNTYTIDSPNKVFGTTIPSGYSVEITLETPDDLGLSGDLDLLKKVTVKVKYKLNNEEKSVELSKIIQREQIRESNSPKFDEKCLSQLGGATVDNSIILPYDNAEGAAENQTIICPIKYNGQTYEIIETSEDFETMWYSYSNKQWARVLLLNSLEYEECKEDANKISEKLKSDNSYVWIPRFGAESTTRRYLL